jgi:hypothetical protein
MMALMGRLWWGPSFACLCSSWTRTEPGPASLLDSEAVGVDEHPMPHGDAQETLAVVATLGLGWKPIVALDDSPAVGHALAFAYEANSLLRLLRAVFYLCELLWQVWLTCSSSLSCVEQGR